MTDDTTTGIPDPDKPGRWLVPPWPADAEFSEVVRHFLRFHRWGNASTTHLLAYFEGYEAALEAAPHNESAATWHRRWSEDMRDCVGRCARLYREQHAKEASRNVSALRVARDCQTPRAHCAA